MACPGKDAKVGTGRAAGDGPHAVGAGLMDGRLVHIMREHRAITEPLHVVYTCLASHAACA